MIFYKNSNYYYYYYYHHHHHHHHHPLSYMRPMFKTHVKSVPLTI